MASNMIGNLAVNLTMETAAFQRGASIAEKRAQAMQTRMQGIGNSVKGIGAGLAAGFAAAGAGALISNAFQIASSLQEAAAATGVTVEQLQRLRVAASQNGASADQMDASLSKLNATLGAAQQGSKQAVAAFENIGLSVQQLKGLNAADALALIIEKLSAIKDPTLQAAAAKQILGKSYAQLMPLIKGGTAALNEATEASKRNGEISTQDAAKLDQLADGWDMLKTRVGVGIANIIASLANGAESFDNFFRPINKFAADFDAAFVRMATNAVNSVKNLFYGVKTWLVDKMATQFSFITKKIEALGQTFYQLYDDVVGNSYVPDMVVEVNQWFAKMESGMTGSATRATQTVSEKMEAMRANVGGILSRLFPESMAITNLEKQMADLTAGFDKGIIPLNIYREAMSKLQKEMGNAQQAAKDATLPPMPIVDELMKADFGVFTDKISNIGIAANDNADDVETSNVRIVESYADMAKDVMSSISGLAQSIKGGGILGILEGVVGLFTTLGKTGLLGSGIQTKLNAPARAKGGPVSGGKPYLVGERGPELFTSNRSGYITSNKNMAGGGRAVSLSIVPSPYFNAVVDGRADGRVTLASPSIASAAAQGVQTNLQQSGFRALP